MFDNRIEGGFGWRLLRQFFVEQAGDFFLGADQLGFLGFKAHFF